MKTLNQIKAKLNQLQQEHLQLNRFSFGDPWEFGADEAVLYPLMGVSIEPGTLAKNVLSQKFNFYFCDRVESGEAHETEALSDMQQVALDIFAQFSAWCRDNGIVLSAEATISDFTERFDDSVAGWQVEVTMNQFYARDQCQVPGVSSYVVLESEDYILTEDEGKIIL